MCLYKLLPRFLIVQDKTARCRKGDVADNRGVTEGEDG